MLTRVLSTLQHRCCILLFQRESKEQREVVTVREKDALPNLGHQASLISTTTQYFCRQGHSKKTCSTNLDARSMLEA